MEYVRMEPSEHKVIELFLGEPDKTTIKVTNGRKVGDVNVDFLRRNADIFAWKVFDFGGALGPKETGSLSRK